MRAHMPVIFSIQETRTWDVPKPGVARIRVLRWQCWARHLVCFVSVLQNKRSWKLEERCTAVLFCNHFGDGCLRSGLREKLGIYEGIHLECYQGLARRTPRRCQRIFYLHDMRSQCGVGVDVYRRRRHRGAH